MFGTVRVISWSAFENRDNLQLGVLEGEKIMWHSKLFVDGLCFQNSTWNTFIVSARFMCDWTRAMSIFIKLAKYLLSNICSLCHLWFVKFPSPPKKMSVFPKLSRRARLCQCYIQCRSGINKPLFNKSFVYNKFLCIMIRNRYGKPMGCARSSHGVVFLHLRKLPGTIEFEHWKIQGNFFTFCLTYQAFPDMSGVI